MKKIIWKVKSFTTILIFIFQYEKIQMKKMLEILCGIFFETPKIEALTVMTMSACKTFVCNVNEVD